MSVTFTHPGPATVSFGPGALDLLPAAVASLGGESVLVVTDPGVVAAGILDAVLAAAGGLVAGGLEVTVFAEVEPNPTTTTVARGVGLARQVRGPVVVVAVGGGSAMDAAKAIATGAVAVGDGALPVGALPVGALPVGALPVVAVPTTAGTGAETNGFGVIEDVERRCKVYLGDAAATPRVCLLDPTLTHGLSAAATAATGVDALVHAVESLTSRGRTPITEAHAHRALRLVARWLPVAVADGTHAEARAQLLLGAHLAGLALTGSGLGLVHGLGHAVTAHTGTPHGLALAAVLEQVLALNLAECTDALAEMAHDLGVSGGTPEADAAAALVRIGSLVREVGAYRPLRSHGVDEALVDTLVAAALADPVSANAPVLPGPERLREVVLASL